MATTGTTNMQAKLVLLGDMGAGKSSLVLRFVKGQFYDYQERYHSLAPMYYRGAAAAIIVYDITNNDSFSRAKKWVQELQGQGNANLVMALAGNKADLASKRKVETEEAQKYADENGLFFMETSAKSAQNVNELFYEIARKLPKAQPHSGMLLSDRPTERTKSSCCA